MLVLVSVGIPAEGIALIIAMDRPLDMLITAVNVSGDAMAACVVSAGETIGGRRDPLLFGRPAAVFRTIVVFN